MCGGISQLTDMRVLKLKKNNLAELPYELCELKRIEILNIHHNRIFNFPFDLRLLSNLKFITCDTMVDLGDNYEMDNWNRVLIKKKCGEL